MKKMSKRKKVRKNCEREKNQTAYEKNVQDKKQKKVRKNCAREKIRKKYEKNVQGKKLCQDKKKIMKLIKINDSKLRTVKTDPSQLKYGKGNQVVK